jgi:hypothetical protein
MRLAGLVCITLLSGCANQATAGAILAGTGILVTIAGVTVTAAHCEPDTGFCHDVAAGNPAVGVPVLVAGGVLVVSGVMLIATDNAAHAVGSSSSPSVAKPLWERPTL